MSKKQVLVKRGSKLVAIPYSVYKRNKAGRSHKMGNKHEFTEEDESEAQRAFENPAESEFKRLIERLKKEAEDAKKAKDDTGPK